MRLNRWRTQGSSVGELLGLAEVGDSEGDIEGGAVGDTVGDSEGDADGAAVRDSEGGTDGGDEDIRPVVFIQRA